MMQNRPRNWTNPRLMAYALLSVYSAALLYAHYRTSEGRVRVFFTDIGEMGQLYGINTTLSALLLWSAALLFVLNLDLLSRGERPAVERFFLASQALFFAYLGLDDRFLLHEQLMKEFGMSDGPFLLALGGLEIALLVTVGRLRERTPQARRYLLLGAGFFALTLGIDQFHQHISHTLIPLRLSLEDLSKAWGCLFFFLFAWEIFRDSLEGLLVASPGRSA